MEDVKSMSDAHAARPAPRTFTAREIAGGVLAIVLLVFALANLEKVTIDLIFGQLTLPVFFVIAIAALLGFGVGWLFRRRHRT